MSPKWQTLKHLIAVYAGEAKFNKYSLLNFAREKLVVTAIKRPIIRNRRNLVYSEYMYDSRGHMFIHPVIQTYIFDMNEAVFCNQEISV